MCRRLFRKGATFGMEWLGMSEKQDARVNKIGAFAG